MSNSPLHPPVPFSDFEFTFDPSLSNLFPNPPPLPSSADLFSPAETTDIFGFLDNFGTYTWDFENKEPPYNEYIPNSLAPYSNPHLNTALNQSSYDFDGMGVNRAHSTTSDSSSTTSPTFTNGIDKSNLAQGTPRSKPLLSTPQKRLNHIMSEQKRRNAIRDGYAQLISLLAPAGAPGIGMPTRGRPKGSGSRGKGQTKGKSGVLFRAVEYCRWLEEGRDALQEEVSRAEAAAGIHHQ
ncbi:hypothetical protein BD779DRAFT_1607737 [Infundibulicybe gibba]|nr:hypothetical protein BD779DRAFT_1607737 [Infundibulicybe gibba]